MAAEEIAAGIGAVSARALSEALRRSPDRFTQLRPEGTWALKDWQHVDGTTYRDATEAVIAAVTDAGPLSLQQLVSETIRRYPVTAWRVGQCIFSREIGKVEGGLFDLVTRGALPVPAQEPTRPAHMADSGNLLGLRLGVTRDVLRGSGIGVSTWLTWKLGLHYYPSQIEFDGDYPVIVRRHSSGASISSLRSFVVDSGLREDCTIFVVLDRHLMQARLRHGRDKQCEPS
ncbi:hypothetical protein [Paenarthrobacter sp. YIM B13468]|uniref:hypothetical protein n=1 Tax=Paenarthrobacter sp. YIM B13468 TaxID=3366295 RepID=UPI00366ACC8E